MRVPRNTTKCGSFTGEVSFNGKHVGPVRRTYARRKIQTCRNYVSVFVSEKTNFFFSLWREGKAAGVVLLVGNEPIENADKEGSRNG